MKIIEKSKVARAISNTSLATKGTLNEMLILKGLHHPNIVQLKEVLDDENEPNIYLVM